jgi:hypothetical protein
MVTTPATDKGALEWIPEKRFGAGEYGTFPTNPSMLSLGLISDFTVHADRKLKGKTYLRAHPDAAKLGQTRTRPTGGTVEGSFTMLIQYRFYVIWMENILLSPVLCLQSLHRT